jgi:type IV secretory pathway TrbL component
MAAGDTLSPSGMATDKYLEDISADELSADAPSDGTAANRALDVSVTGSATNDAGGSETTSPSAILRKLSKQRSITAIARQAQGIRAREVIAKLAEDAYFMRVDNRVNQPRPARNRDNEV